MFEITHFIDLADAYLAATSTKEVTLSHRVFGDSKKLTAIRNGADITVGRLNGAIEWFSENWPAGAEWPSSISRPTPASDSEVVA